MSSVFVDTSFYIAFLSPRDKWHQEAVRTGGNPKDTMITTEFILVELGNHLCTPAQRHTATEFISMLYADKKTHIIPASSSLLKSGIALFNQRTDKSWSLTDCISFAVMQEQGIQRAFSCDHHFLQAGFRVTPID